MSDAFDRLSVHIGRVPVAKALGMRLASAGDGQAEIEMDARAEHLQEMGVVQGGILSALADTAAVFAIVTAAGESRAMTSIEFKMNFLRPAVVDKGPLRARARVIQAGRRVGLVDVDVEQAGKLVATGLFTYLFTDG